MTRLVLPIATVALLSLPLSAAAASPLSLHSRLGEEPAGEAPTTTEPAGEAGTDAPGTDMPGTDAPGTDMPGTDAPGTDAPGEGTEPPAEGEPAEGPTEDTEPSEGDEYASSKDAGQGMSGEERTWKGAPSDTEEVGVDEDKKLTHLMTGQVGAAVGVGWGLITAGDKYCGEFSSGQGDADGRKSLCTGLVPAFLDLSVGFGAARRLDIVVAVRINLQKRDYDDSGCDGAEACTSEKGLFVDARGIGVMPGVRLWGKDNNKIFKVGGALDLLYMHEKFSGYHERPAGPGEDADPDNAANEDGVSDHILGLRGGPIIQIDPHHNVGIFIIPAAVPSFRPGGEQGLDTGWFEIGFEGSVGVQARFP